MHPYASDDSLDVAREHGPILGHYVSMAQVLGEMFNPVLETVVHDLRTPNYSIIAIFNGHITNREIGDPATDICLKLIKGDFPDVLIGYENESPDGHKLKSSSLAIRNKDNELIGAMGINMDVSYFKQFERFIEQFIASERSEHTQSGEEFHNAVPTDMTTPREDIQDSIEHFITSRCWNSRVLSNEDKREVVEYLYRTGHFKKRGAVKIIADELSLTRSSIYNYKNEYTDKNKD